MLDRFGTQLSTGAALPQQRDATTGGFGMSLELDAEQATAPPPAELAEIELHADLSLLNLAQLRERRTKLTELEGRVSYWRRIIQARLDLLRDGSLKRGATVEGLQRVLSQQLGPNSRKMMLDVHGDGSQAPPVAGLSQLWSRGINASDDEEFDLEADLVVAEQVLSTRRSELHDDIDAATAELVARYRDDPALALTALPVRAARPTPL